MADPGIHVRVIDRVTGDADKHTLQPGGYVVIWAQPAYVASEQVHANGTRIVVVKRREPAGPVYVNPRGVCPVCGTERAVTPRGVLVHHNAQRKRWATECLGSERPPRPDDAGGGPRTPSTSDIEIGETTHGPCLVRRRPHSPAAAACGSRPRSRSPTAPARSGGCGCRSV